MHRIPPFRSRRTLGALLALACLAATPLARADALADLKKQVEALQKQVQQLEEARKQAPAAPPATAQAVTGGATPGSFKLPGSDTSVRLFGYAKLDAVFSSRSAGVQALGDTFLFPSQIPVGPGAGDTEKKQVTLHGRQSRFGISTSTPSKFGNVTTLIELDFYGADGNEVVSNSHAPRIRHVYGSIGKLSGGQFWTNFSNPGAYAETLDFGGPVGLIFIRQAQVRWTQPFEGGSWAIAAESPDSVLSQSGRNPTVRPDDDRIPDLTGSVYFTSGKAKYSLHVLARNIRIDTQPVPLAGTVPASPAFDSDKWGAAIGATGIIPVFGQNDFRFNINAGNVLGRYQELGFFPDGHIDANGQVELADAVSGYVAYRHFWAPGLRSNFVLSASRADNPSSIAGNTINKEAQSVHLNLIWSPVPQVNLGAEYIFARREVENGLSGTLNRVQFSGQYSF